MSFKNTTVRGFGVSEVKHIRSMVNETSLHLDIAVFSPFLDMEGLYRGQGNLFGFQYKSKGYGNFSFGRSLWCSEFFKRKTFSEKVSAVWKMDGIVEERNGEKYVKIVKFDTRPKMKSAKIYATGLLPDPDLNELAIQFVNQVWDRLYEQMFPQTRQIWEPIFLNSINKIFGRVPFRRLMPKE